MKKPPLASFLPCLEASYVLYAALNDSLHLVRRLHDRRPWCTPDRWQIIIFPLLLRVTCTALRPQSAETRTTSTSSTHEATVSNTKSVLQLPYPVVYSPAQPHIYRVGTRSRPPKPRVATLSPPPHPPDADADADADAHTPPATTITLTPPLGHAHSLAWTEDRNMAPTTPSCRCQEPCSPCRRRRRRSPF